MRDEKNGHDSEGRIAAREPGASRIVVKDTNVLAKYAVRRVPDDDAGGEPPASAPGRGSDGGSSRPEGPSSGRRNLFVAATVAALFAVAGSAGFSALQSDDEPEPVAATPPAPRKATTPTAEAKFVRLRGATDEKGSATLTKTPDDVLWLNVELSAPDAAYMVRYKARNGRVSRPINRNRNAGSFEQKTSAQVLSGRYDFLEVIVRRRGSKARKTLRLNTDELYNDLSDIAQR